MLLGSPQFAHPLEDDLHLQEQPVQILIFDKIQIMNHIIDSVAIIDHTNKCGYTALHLFCKTNSTQDFE